MVFNILIDNTDAHEKNHVLLVDATQRYRLSPAFDIVPTCQAMGYQQMRVGTYGTESTLQNALSEHRAFALTSTRASEVVGEVATVVGSWQTHFARHGVTKGDMAQLQRAIDREFLYEQRLRTR